MRTFAVLFGLVLIVAGLAATGPQLVPMSAELLEPMPTVQNYLLRDGLLLGAILAILGCMLILFRAKLKPRTKRIARPNVSDTKPSPLDSSTGTRDMASRPQSTTSTILPETREELKSEPEADSSSTLNMLNEHRASDLAKIEMALRAYHSATGAFPYAEHFHGRRERGEDWIPGLAPRFIATLPSDPTQNGISGPQYVYISNSLEFKLLVLPVAVEDESPLQRTGAQIDHSKGHLAPNKAFGFWTEGFSSI